MPTAEDGQLPLSMHFCQTAKWVAYIIYKHSDWTRLDATWNLNEASARLGQLKNTIASIQFNTLLPLRTMSPGIFSDPFDLSRGRLCRKNHGVSWRCIVPSHPGTRGQIRYGRIQYKKAISQDSEN